MAIKAAISQAAAILGRKGGKVKSTKKTEAARKNAKLPRKKRRQLMPYICTKYGNDPDSYPQAVNLSRPHAHGRLQQLPNGTWNDWSDIACDCQPAYVSRIHRVTLPRVSVLVLALTM